MTGKFDGKIESFIGGLPYRMALAGGWIDQPFISSRDLNPPGSMVVVNLQPEFLFMDRAGMGTSTRKIALQLWGNRIPDGDPRKLMHVLYWAENEGKHEPSGSQDMAGLIYPGINRLDYTVSFEDGIFPQHVETCLDLDVLNWLSSILYLLPVMPRPPGYHPLGIKILDPIWISRLGQSGKDCYNAIVTQNIADLGKSFNECMKCWEALLPHTVRHETIKIDLVGILEFYQSIYEGAMYSGCGGGYLIVVSEKPVPGGFQVKVRSGS